MEGSRKSRRNSISSHFRCEKSLSNPANNAKWCDTVAKERTLDWANNPTQRKILFFLKILKISWNTNLKRHKNVKRTTFSGKAPFQERSTTNSFLERNPPFKLTTKFTFNASKINLQRILMKLPAQSMHCDNRIAKRARSISTAQCNGWHVGNQLE